MAFQGPLDSDAFHNVFATNSTVTPFTSTTEAPRPYPVFVGYICALTAVVLYGSNFVPIKKYYTGDGMFFQWVLCSGIFLVGIVLQLVQNYKFYPLVMVGGAIWATGNLCVVPIFKTIGMGLGLSIWGSFSLVVGWASGKFGLFGTNKDQITHVTMNYIGVVLAFLSIILYVMVKNEVSAKTDIEVTVDGDDEPLLGNVSPGSINESVVVGSPGLMAGSTSDYSVTNDDILVFSKHLNRTTNGVISSSGGKPLSEELEEVHLASDRMFLDDLSPNRKRVVGSVLSVLSGLMYGINFTPAIYVQDNVSHDKNGLNYVFAHFCGIYLASCVYFFLYCAIRKNKPKVYPSVILPGVLSGILWGIATACWFIANAEISESVSFPIVNTGPSAIASLFWGVCVFREIKGFRNICVLLVAFCVMTTGAVLAGLSR